MIGILLPAALGIAGAYILYRGAALLIDSSTRLAQNVGIPLVVIGVTIIAFGTSVPELVVGVVAAVGGQSELVLGNIIGSNMANLGLVLGIAALIRPVSVPLSGRFEVYNMVFAVSVLYLMARDGMVGRIDGAILVALGAAFTAIVLRKAKSSNVIEQVVERAVTIQHRKERVWNVIAILAGIGLLFVGARMMVTNAVTLARAFGVSDVLIGLTLVAIGTSLPEIVTTTIASLRKDTSLTVGNIVGSNVLNILIVLGLTVIIAPISVTPPVWRYDLPLLVLGSLLAISFIRSGRTVSRPEGVVLIACYTAYVLFAFVVRAGQPLPFTLSLPA